MRILHYRYCRKTMERPYLFHAWRRIGAYLSNARSGLLFTDHPAVLELHNSMSIRGVALSMRDLNDGGAPVVESVHRLIEEMVFGAPRAVQHANDAEQRGFPRAGRAHEGYELTGLNIDANAAQDEKLAAAGLEDLLEISHLNQRFHKLSLSCR